MYISRARGIKKYTGGEKLTLSGMMAHTCSPRTEEVEVGLDLKGSQYNK